MLNRIIPYYVQDYVQDVRYFAIEHMDVRREAFQLARHLHVRYFAIEHMDVRREESQLARR
ncbi:MAG: hypothetical protein KJN61_00440 [Gammaproteobacteria bacterium]|nr:hypothetical protein [Gammaproteobacteria bacterium]NNK97516.1 hypothetical protein [Xanthomonadales bacterium]